MLENQYRPAASSFALASATRASESADNRSVGCIVQQWKSNVPFEFGNVAIFAVCDENMLR